MQVKIKLDAGATMPKYATDGSAGMDLTAISKEYDEYGNVVYDTGIHIELPKNYVALIFPRSSISKYDMSLTNAVGVIDSDYRGSIKFKFKGTETSIGAMVNKSHSATKGAYEIGDRIGQMIIVPYPTIEFKQVDKLSDTERGNGGFGSTGKGGAE